MALKVDSMGSNAAAIMIVSPACTADRTTTLSEQGSPASGLLCEIFRNGRSYD
jgi:hypothetical protein